MVWDYWACHVEGLRIPDSRMIRGTGNKVVFLIIIVIVLGSVRCSMFRSLGLARPVFREDFSQLDPSDFPAKIEELEGIARAHKNEHVRTRALFYIALAYLHYNNPSPDYSMAIRYMDEYIERDADNQDIDEIMAWKSTLLILDNSLHEHEKLEKEYARLKQQYESTVKKGESLNTEIDNLGQLIEKQKKEISSLKEIIKKLDALHREIEKKKKIR